MDERLSELDDFISDQPELNAAGEAVEVQEIDTKAFLTDTLQLGFSVIAAKAGDHWALSGQEAEALAGAYDAVLDKYFPNIGKSLGVEVTAITITAMVFLPRYQQSAALRAASPGLSTSAESGSDQESGGDDFGLDNLEGAKHGN